MKIFLLSVFLFLPIFAFSTCIIIVVTDTSIIIAADSKRSMHVIDVYGNIHSVTPQQICKIHKVNNYYFVIAGLNDSMILHAIKNACLKSNNIDTVIQKYDEAMKTEYFQTVVDYRKISKEHYTKRFPGTDRGVAQVTLIQHTQEGVRFNHLEHFVKNKDESPVSMYMKMGFGEYSIKCLGVCNDMFNSPTTPVVNSTLAEKLKNLIEIQIKAHGEHVGYPIKVLEITTTGHKWLLGKEPCMF